MQHRLRFLKILDIPWPSHWINNFLDLFGGSFCWKVQHKSLTIRWQAASRTSNAVTVVRPGKPPRAWGAQSLEPMVRRRNMFQNKKKHLVEANKQTNMNKQTKVQKNINKQKNITKNHLEHHYFVEARSKKNKQKSFRTNKHVESHGTKWFKQKMVNICSEDSSWFNKTTGHLTWCWVDYGPHVWCFNNSGCSGCGLVSYCSKSCQRTGAWRWILNDMLS